MLNSFHHFKKRVLIFGLGLFFCLSSFAQGQFLRWRETQLELGMLTEGDSVSGFFQFQNVSKGPVILKKLQTTCGCTSTNFVEGKSIAPQSVDSFAYRFLSAGQVGHLHKLLVVEYEANQLNFSDTLLLHGEVQPPQPPYRARFPYKNEHMLLLTPLVVFGNISEKEVAKAKITLGLEGRKKEKVEVLYLPKGFRLKSKWIKEQQVNVLWLEVKLKKLENKGFVEIPFLLKGKKTGETFDMKLSYYLEGNR
jgi:hypothetical protein